MSTFENCRGLKANRKKSLIICADWFEPAIRAGGPIRSCVNLTELVGQDYKTTVITSNKDLGELRPIGIARSNQWVNWKCRAAVIYSESAIGRMCIFFRMIRKRPASTVYLNSMFSMAGTLWPLLLMWIIGRQTQVVLAPRGMLKPSALSIKHWKKSPLLLLLRWSGIVQHTRFQATSDDEAAEINKTFGNVAICNIPNVPSKPLATLPEHAKICNHANLCFVGRIAPIKNLDWLLDVLKDIDGEVSLDVIGPAEDKVYYEHCQQTSRQLPGNIQVNFQGTKSVDEVRALLVRADAMVLPTKGENFGHAIFESLAAGTPVLISDRTAWRDLYKQQAGWDLTIESKQPFRKAIDEIVGMNARTHRLFRAGALNVALEFMKMSRLEERYRELFNMEKEHFRGK